MTAPAPPPIQQWLDRLKASEPADHDRRLAALEAQQSTSTVALAALVQMITNLEVRMSQTEDAVAELNTETNNLAARLDAILAREASLDSTVAGEIREVSSRLKGLAADPANPVPDPTPTPEPTPEPVPGPGDGEVTNPTPVDENGNPV